jgi:hypothetical protein
LTYQLDCRGSGRQLIEQIPAGGTAAVALLPGDWEITVTVLNAAGESIGSGSAAALINSGETTTIQMPIAIDTGGNDIASFLITSPADAVGTINTNTNTITVLVPQETNTSQMTFTAVHTGRSISPESGTKVNFTTPKSFTVIAENSLTKSYTVTVIPSLPPSMTDWPSDATWQVYGLGGLTQPGGTVVRGAVDLPSGLVVTLGSADQNAFDSLIEQIEESLSQRGLKTSTPIGSTYSLSYRYNGKGHSLTLVFSMGMLVMEL